jgi:hypothetical protein
MSVIILIGIIYNMIIITYLPYIKGYFSYGTADTIYHINLINYIIINGNISIDNFYPLSHILASISILITDIYINNILIIMMALLGIIFIFSIFSLIKRVVQNKNIALLASFLCLLCFTGEYVITFVPNAFALILLPLFLFSLLLKNQEKNLIPMIIIQILLFTTIVFFHVLVAIFILLVLILYYLIDKYIIKSSVNISKNFIWIGFISIIGWLSYTVLWDPTFIKLINWLNGETIDSPVESATQVFSNSSIPIINIISIVLLTYGHLIIMLFAVIVFLIVLIKRKIKYSFFWCIGLLITSIIISLIWVLTPTGIDPYRPIRYVAIPLMISFVLCIFYLYEYKLIKKISYILIIIMLLIGVTSVYPSPHILKSNQQLTESSVITYNFNFTENSCVYTVYDKSRYFNSFNNDDINNSDFGDHYENFYNSTGDSYLLTTTEDMLFIKDVSIIKIIEEKDQLGIMLSNDTDLIYNNYYSYIYFKNR